MCIRDSPHGSGFRAPLEIGEHGAQHHIGEMTLQAAQGLEPGLALGHPPRHIRLGARIGPGLDEGDRVEGPIELSVAAPVEAMSACLTRGCRDGCRSAHPVSYTHLTLPTILRV